MPVTYAFEDKTLIIAAAGHYEITDITRAFDAALANPQFKPGLSLLLDWRQSLEMPRLTELPSRWANLASVKSLFSPQVAFIATQAAVLERASMFAAYARPQGFRVETFTDMDEARRWLRACQEAEP